MKKVTVYHNPRCSKSREVLSILDQENIEYNVINYIQNPINEKELEKVLKYLGIPASELVRTNDTLFKKLFKDKRDNLTEKDYLTIMIEHPTLMQRPIVVINKNAIIGRPPELVLEAVS